MTLCQRCKNLEGKFKIMDKSINAEVIICEYCEGNNDTLIEIIDKTKPVEQIEYGRLHLVKKCKKDFQCRMCEKEISVGSSCYTQSIHKKPFPIQTRLCMSCGETLIVTGTIVAK